MTWADDAFNEGLAAAREPLPVNYEVEQALLSALLHDNATFESVGAFLKAGHFAEPVHGVIYQAIADRCLQRAHVDAKTLKLYFDQQPALAEVGGGEYLAKLEGSTIACHPTAVLGFGRTIHELAMRRKMIEAAEDLDRKARQFDFDEDMQALIEQHEAEILSISSGASEAKERGARRLGDILAGEVLPEIERRAQHEGALTGLTTGFRDLDELTGGLEAPEIVVLAGRPSMGKTTLLTNMAVRMAFQGRASLIYSLEMGQGALATRILAERTAIPFTALQRGSRYDMHDQLALQDAAKAFAAAPVFVDDRPGLTVHQMHAGARRLQRQQQLDCLFVDHIGYVTPPDIRAPRYQQLGQIMKELRRVAKDLGVPIVVLCQLNRASVAGDDKRPRLEHLRESGQIEEDADQVWFMHREAYFLERAKPKTDAELSAWEADMAAEKERADLIVAKQRNGPIGTVRLFFDAKRMKADDLAEDGT